MDKVRALVAAGILAISWGYAPRVEAALINGDFSAGLTGWAGEVTDISLATTGVGPLPGTFSGNFDASSGAAVLTTSTLTDDIFSVFMFQEFVIDPVAPGQSLILTYGVTPVLSDAAFGDTAFAQLNYSAPGFPNTIDLLTAISVDVTFLAGETVELLFGVEDSDDVPDSLTVDNIAVTVTAIPLPGTLPLLTTALAIFGIAARRRRRTG